jgi:hypothetical protein
MVTHAALVSLFTAALFGAELKVDHVTIAGRNLQAMRTMFEAAGLSTEYGGKHTNGLTEMALASFADGSYLELIAAQSPAGAAAHYWGKFIDGQAGPCAWAVAVEDLTAEGRRLKEAGVAIDPTRSGRMRPDGVALAWQSASVGPGPQGTFFPFLIHDETPRERRVYPHDKPTMPAVAGVALVVIAVRDLDSAIARYRKVFGLAEPVRQDDAGLGAHLASFAGTPVVLAGSSGSGSWLSERLDAFGEAPCVFVLSTKTQTFKVSGKADWFGHPIAWLALGGMRIGIMR